MEERNGYPDYWGTQGQEGTDSLDPWGQPVFRRVSPEEEIKAARKHFSKLGLMFVIGTIVIYAAQIIAVSAVYAWKPEWLWNADITLLLSVLPMYLIGMPVLILLVRQVPAEKIARRPMKAGSFAVSVIMCFAIVYISNIAGNIVTWIIGMLKGSTVQNQIVNVATSINTWTVVIYMVICAPFMEEYVFRKLIVDRTVKYGQGVAVLLSGLMFGLFHGNLNQFVYAFTLGMFLAFLYVKTGKLKITIALHMMINFMGGVVSSKLLEWVDIEEYIRILSGGTDMERIAEYMNEHILGWIAYLFFMLFVFGVMIAGAVLIIVFLVKKKISFERGEVTLPKGKRFRTVILNVGMVLYCVVWVGMIFWQMFGNEIRMLVDRIVG